ncbi:MAG: glycosyltransferase family 39 protein, partial [candidate division Zixibacteria bacterium]|nr:glycosyltransferase family 39 protein [candidate division Zixibacteria bacterium]
MLQRLIETANRHKRLAMVLAVAALVRLIYLYLYQTMPEWTLLTIDNYYHHHWAQSIAAGNILGDTTYFRAPFYVFSLAALSALLGSSLWVGRIFGLVIGLVSIGATYRIGERMANRRTGLLAA